MLLELVGNDHLFSVLRLGLAEVSIGKTVTFCWPPTDESKTSGDGAGTNPDAQALSQHELSSTAQQCTVIPWSFTKRESREGASAEKAVAEIPIFGAWVANEGQSKNQPSVQLT